MALQLLILALLLLHTCRTSEVTYYELLGVTKTATQQDIRQAFKKLAVKMHPDKTKDTKVQQEFVKISEAYETLKDPDKRRQYDMYGTFQTYSRRYDSKSQAEYNNLYYNGLYAKDEFVENWSGKTYFSHLTEGFYFVNFYSPFCPPCQNLADTWKRLAEKYQSLIKMAAVNCKLHHSFCSNTMRVGHYPTLLFYPDGKDGGYHMYRGEHRFDALEHYVMSFVGARVKVGVARTLTTDYEMPTVYVLSRTWFDDHALLRLAYMLKDAATVVKVESEELRRRLTPNEDAVVAVRLGEAALDLESPEEADVIHAATGLLPPPEFIDVDRLKEVRNRLRRGEDSTWMLYFVSGEERMDRLLLYRLQRQFTDVNFGVVECSRWVQLCLSLGVGESAGAGAGAWAALKAGGAYERAAVPPSPPALAAFLRAARATTNLHSLSPAEFTRILEGDSGVWVVAVAPHQAAWDLMADGFTHASQQFLSHDLQFGIMSCGYSTEQYCRSVGGDAALVLLVNGTRRHPYTGPFDARALTRYLHLAMHSRVVHLDENQFLQVLDTGRHEAWLVAFLPSHCPPECMALAHQWELLAEKLSPLAVRVALLDCASAATTFCGNVRSPTIKLFPKGSAHTHAVGMLQVELAPYMWEWAIDKLGLAIDTLDAHGFRDKVVAAARAHDHLMPEDSKPWLVYFHSERCYRCYEMYADFAIAATMLGGAVRAGRLSCLSERGVCQREAVTSYPAVKLYLPPPHRALHLRPADHEALLREVRAHLARGPHSRAAHLDAKMAGISHDEF